MAKLRKFVYDSDGVGFTIYATIKSSKSRRTRYWLLEEYSAGKRRWLSNKTKKAAEERGDTISASMVAIPTARHAGAQRLHVAFDELRSLPWQRCVRRGRA